MLTEFTTNSALKVELWHEKLYRDAAKNAYFSRFMKADSDSIVEVKTDLEKKDGDTIHFGIRMRLTGAGVTGDNVLENNEESLVTYEMNIVIDQLRHGVRSKGTMSEKRVLFSVPEESRSALRDWMSEQIDQKCFNALDASPTKIFYGGNATSTADVDATDILTLDFISKVKTWGSTGGNRSQPPLRGINIGGKKHYVLLIHPDVAYDLKTSSEWKQAQREAQIRGAENPLFTGAIAMWDDVIIHTHENIPITTTWGAGSNVAGARCQLLGAQALCWAWGKRPFVKEESFDYGNQRGHAIGIIYGVKKPIFNSKDFGSIGCFVARTKVSDA